MVLDWTKKDFPVLNLSFWPMFKINLNQQKNEASVMYTFWTMPILMFSPVSTFGDQSLVISLLPYQISGIYWIILLSTNAFIHQSSCLLFISIFLTKFPLEISMKCNITHPIHATFYNWFSKVARFENPGVLVLFGGHNLPSLVEIGLTDLSEFGGAMASPAPPGTTGLEVGIVPTSH